MTTIEQPREAFLAERRRGIGGSDVAAVVEIDPKKTRYQLWREKVGMPDEDGGKPHARRRGSFLEAAILARYAEALQPSKFEVRIPHEIDGWRRGNQDARAVMPDGRRIVVEAKSINRNVLRSTANPENQWGDPWTDEVPQRVLCQGLWYADLDQADGIDFPVLVVPEDPDEVLGLTADEVVAISEFRVYRAMRNRAVEEWLVSEAQAFWQNHVMTRVPPAAVPDDVAARWPSHVPGKSKDASEIADKLKRFDELRLRQSEDKKEADQLRAEILLFAQDAEWLIVGAIPALTLRKEERAAHAVAASSSRVLRFTKPWKDQGRPTTQTKTEN